jgi:hypothetical protein
VSRRSSAWGAGRSIRTSVAASSGHGRRVEGHVDQWAALAEADLFVTHRGLNSTREAIFQEVPMLSYPFFGDQLDQARRCQGLGLALALTETPTAPLDAAALKEAPGRLERDRCAIARNLAEASAWEREVMAARGGVPDRIAMFGATRGAAEARLPG